MPIASLEFLKFCVTVLTVTSVDVGCNIRNVKYKMKMFVTAVCFLFLLKLKWPKDKSIYDAYSYRLNTKIHLTMLCLSGFELYSRWVPLFCRNPRVIFVKVVVCCAHYINSLFLWYVCVETCDVH